MTDPLSGPGSPRERRAAAIDLAKWEQMLKESGDKPLCISTVLELSCECNSMGSFQMACQALLKHLRSNAGERISEEKEYTSGVVAPFTWARIHNRQDMIDWYTTVFLPSLRVFYPLTHDQAIIIIGEAGHFGRFDTCDAVGQLFGDQLGAMCNWPNPSSKCISLLEGAVSAGNLAFAEWLLKRGVVAATCRDTARADDFLKRLAGWRDKAEASVWRYKRENTEAVAWVEKHAQAIIDLQCPEARAAFAAQRPTS